MAIQIPNMPNVQNAPALARDSVRSAMAPGLAMQSVADGIDDARDVINQNNERILHVQNSADLTEIKTKLKTAYADFQAGLTEDHDYTKYREKWEGRLGQLQKELAQSDVSPMVRDQASQYFDNFQGDTRIGVSAAMQRKAVERAKQGYANGFENAVRAYDPATGAGGEAIDELLGDQSWMTPEEKEHERQRFEQAAKEKQELFDIHDDPGEWLEQNAEPSKEDPGKWATNQRRAKTLVRQEAADAFDEAADMMAEGKLTDPDMVDDLFANLRPAVRERLKAEVAARSNHQEMEERKHPSYQMRIAGKISSMMDDYDPTGKLPDGSYVEIATLVEQIENKALKSEFTDRLKNIRKGHFLEIEDNKKLAFKELDKTFFDEKAAKLKKEYKVLPFIDHGLLGSEKRLMEMGFSADQADEIASEEGTEQKKMFRQLWGARENPDKAKEDTFEFRIGRAYAMRESSIEVIDDAGLDKLNEEHGEAKMELAEWLQAYPDANETAIRDKLKSLGVQTKARFLRDNLWDDDEINEEYPLLPPLED